MKTNIALDLTQIPADKTGVGIYAVHLVKELIRLNRDRDEFRFFFFAQDDDPLWPELVEGQPGCTLIAVDSQKYRNLVRRFVFEQVVLPRRCKKLGIHGLYSFHYTIPVFCRAKRLVTIPDMTFYLFPGMHQLVKRIYFKTFIPISLKRSYRVITISESTKNDLLERFPKVDEKKVNVIHLGVENPGTGPELRDIEKHLADFGVRERKYFLYVGTLEPRKNIDGIIRAYHRAVTPNENGIRDYKLVIVGKKGWFYEKIFQTVEELDLRRDVVFTGYADEHVKQALLSRAFLFVYPSFYEGFGLPILESMIYGVPVITGNVSSLPEVAGEAALLVNPGQWREIATAMELLLTDDTLHRQLSEKSTRQASRFSWRNTVEKTMKLFRECGISA